MLIAAVSRLLVCRGTGLLLLGGISAGSCAGRVATPTVADERPTAPDEAFLAVADAFVEQALSDASEACGPFDPEPNLWAQLPFLGLAYYSSLEATGKLPRESPADRIAALLRDTARRKELTAEAVQVASLWIKQGKCRSTGTVSVLGSRVQGGGHGDKLGEWLSRVDVLAFVPLSCEQARLLPPDPNRRLRVMSEHAVLGLILVRYKHASAPLVAGVVTDKTAQGYRFLEEQLTTGEVASTSDIVDPGRKPQQHPCDRLHRKLCDEEGQSACDALEKRWQEESATRLWAPPCARTLADEALYQELKASVGARR